jgi:hypothetical protein
MMLVVGWLGRCASFGMLAAVMVLITEGEAYGYTDPGSGALIWQMLLAASFGAVFYVRKLLAWIGHGKKNRSENKKKDEKIVVDE